MDEGNSKDTSTTPGEAKTNSLGAFAKRATTLSFKSYTTYSGQLVTLEDGAPTIEDVAVGLGRIGRYGGQSRIFWPVLLHSMVVASLLPPRLEARGLIHDAMEILTGDVPSAFKGPEARAVEDILHRRFLISLGLAPLSDKDEALVKQADRRVLFAEAHLVGPTHLPKVLNALSITPDLESISFVRTYLSSYEPNDCIVSNGSAVLRFQNWFNTFRDYTE